MELGPDAYAACTHESPVRHMFDKTLRLPELMLTEKGRVDALLRRDVSVVFLRGLFRERGARKWLAYLDAFLAGDASPKNIF